jgi:hypothetical protein
MTGVRSRLWAAGAAVWTGVFIVLAYIIFDPQLWYMLVVASGGVLALFAASVGADGRRGRTALLVAMGILVVAAILGGFQAGPVLLPAIVSCALGVRNSTANPREIVSR